METPVPLHVLVIEDDPDARSNLQDILELDDYRVEAAGTVAEALGRENWEQFTAIILDRRLPDGTADELLPRLKQLAPGAAILVVTGYADMQGAISALRLGAVDYLLKPINADELRARLGHVAERVRAEKQIGTLASIPAESPNPVLRVGRDGGIRYANSASTPLLDLWGCGVGGTLPGPWQELIREASDAGANREVEVMCGEQTFSLLVAPIAGADYVNVYGRDMTARKQAEEALQHERDFAEGLIETAQAIVLVLDRAGRVVRFNHYTTDLTGHGLEEVKGKDWFSLVFPADEVSRTRAVFLQALATGATHSTLNPVLTKEGLQREIQWSNKALRDAEGRATGVLAIGHDITALREAQRRALQAERLAAIGQMMTGLAHESGNALARSQACLEMLALEVEDRPEATDLISRIRRAQDQLQQLYEEVRNYAAPIRLEREVWNLAMVWRQAWENLSVVRQGRQAALEEKAAGVNLDCLVDAFRLGQVFRNLLENALAAGRDPVRIEILCAEAELAGRPAIRVAVRDNGPGLTPEQRRRIFEPFFTTKARGTGLGMAIARRVVEAHGGQIAVGEGSGPGAEILITLPRGPS
jgi:PAS domain S-box-containing protein